MSVYRQKGLSTLGLLVVLLVVGFFFTAAFKVGPLYLDNAFIQNSLDSLKDKNAEEMSDGDIRRALGNYFTINNVRDIDLKQIEIEREKDRVTVDINYEKRVNFLANVDVVVVFNNRYDSAEAK